MKQAILMAFVFVIAIPAMADAASHDHEMIENPLNPFVGLSLSIIDTTEPAEQDTPKITWRDLKRRYSQTNGEVRQDEITNPQPVLSAVLPVGAAC